MDAFPSSTPDVLLRVSSASEAEEVAFRGAYLFAGGGLQIMDAVTPHEIRGSGALALGIFECHDESGPPLRVELSSGPGGDHAAGTGGRLIVGKNVLPATPLFIRGA